MTDAELSAIEARADALLAPAPECCKICPSCDRFCQITQGRIERFLQAAPTDVPALIAEVRRLRGLAR